MGYAMAMVSREAAAGAGVGVMMPAGASDMARAILGGGGMYDRGDAGAGAAAGGPPEPRHRGSPPGKGKGWKVAYEDVNKNFMVVIRVRPPLPRELHNVKPFQNVVRVDPTERQITISENLNEALDDPVGPYSSHTFTFDHVYDQHCDQRKVYEMTAKGVVESSLQGYNATLFAYGQTGTGKTYTMEGFNSAEERGIIPRAIEQIFKHIQTSVSPRMRFLVRASYLQIYNEVISDLLKPERSNLAIREDKKKGVFVEGLSEWVVRSPQEIYGLMERGGAMRATGSTKMNELSSRSHAVFIIIAEQSETTYLDEHGREMSVEDFHKLVKSRAHGEQGRKLLETNVRQSFKVGKLNLVDLAGSERVRLTGATGQRLEESKSINQSLSALGNVIAALTDPRGRQHIPYRDSKLTRILEDSLGGNCKTTMMAMISPALEAFVESLSTLKFANRAKNIKNEARVNEDLDQKSLLRRYERELKQLRAQLEERSRVVVDQRRLLELDEQRRRAEEDKMAAIRALEARSREFMREKAEKRALEERIAALQGQMLIGGTSKKVQESPAFRSAVKEHQERVRAEYEARLHDLEKERESIEEEKAQVDRYKQLLLKQRDIMILLTQRLNERDEQIVALQDELDAYDQHQRGLENKLDEKTTALIHLQRVTMEHNAASPVKNTDLVDALGPWGKFAERGLDGGAVAGPGGASSVPPKLLITTPQFRPYDAPTVFSGADGAASARESQPSTLLSAEDKIAELARVVETTKTDRDRLAQDLEEIQAEKVSMEYLLREKLEKLVQSQIEVRLASYKHDQAALSDPRTASLMRADLEARTSELASAKAEQTRAEAEVLRLKRRLQGGGGSGGGGGGADDDRDGSRFRDLAARLEDKNALVKRLQEENTRLRESLRGGGGGGGGGGASGTTKELEECVATHEKERRAIQTIMEQKIKSLVDAIASLTMTELGPSGPGARNVQRLLREVQALQRLVNASISALRNSATERQRAAVAATPSSASAAVPLPSSASASGSSTGAVPPAPPMSSRASAASLSSTSTAAPSVASAYGPSGSRLTRPTSAAASGSPSSASVASSSHKSSVEAMIMARKEELQRQRQMGLKG